MVRSISVSLVACALLAGGAAVAHAGGPVGAQSPGVAVAAPAARPAVAPRTTARLNATLPPPTVRDVTRRVVVASAPASQAQRPGAAAAVPAPARVPVTTRVPVAAAKPAPAPVAAKVAAAPAAAPATDSAALGSAALPAAEECECDCPNGCCGIPAAK
jgi:hypothetical protein